MKYLMGLFLFAPATLLSQQKNYSQPAILGAGFFVNIYHDKDHKTNHSSPGIGISYYLPANKLLDLNFNIDGSFTGNIKKIPALDDNKNLLIGISGEGRLRFIGKAVPVNPFISLGLAAFQHSGNFFGLVPAGIGLQLNYKNLFLIPGIKYQLPLSSSYISSFQFNLSILGIVSRRKKATIKKPSNTIVSVQTDKDGDGIIDTQDLCPELPGILKFSGCPDTDNDGIPDKEDQCPRIFGNIKYKGCPVPDSDNDGINDEQDSCINNPGVLKYHGCPIPDNDGDGVNDEEDSCITVPGSKSNKGCPLIKGELSETMQEAAKNILFKTNSYQILPSSFTALNKVAVILKLNPDLNLLIEGHTDSQGNEQSNQLLSENRAKAILDYLKAKGISDTRMKTIGYGQTKPVDSNAIPEGRAKNRRVELKLYY